ncbi:MAG: PilZ domain-containing protein [Magnetococcales bacterium]|nr:PilZ domain-containing protein [Magnetococcales bacterium]
MADHLPASNGAAHQSSSERRILPRFERRQDVTLKVSAERVLWGQTCDLSLQGAFLRINSPMWGLLEGRAATLALAGTPAPQRREWPCQVVRLSRDGVGVRLLDGIHTFASTFEIPQANDLTNTIPDTQTCSAA